MKTFFVIPFFFLFFSCVSQETPVEKTEYPEFTFSPKETPSTEPPVVPQPTVVQYEIPVTEYDSPEDFVSDEEDSEITSSSPTQVVHETVAKFTVVPKREIFSGGAVVYNFIDNHIFRVFLSPLNLSEITLEGGETIVSPPACGDTLNFVLGIGHSMENGVRTEHVYLKPVSPGKSTTLVINTDRRVYRFSLISYEYTFMPLVYFNYPMDSFDELRAAEMSRRANEIIISGDVRNFNFAYEIIPHDIHMPSWSPSMVFTDGVRTFISFPSARRTAYAPVLFKVENRGQRTLVNYRVTGNYYVVDEVLDHAELVLDINAGNVITIKRMN